MLDGAKPRLRQKWIGKQPRYSRRKRLNGRHVQTERTNYFRRLRFRVGDMTMVSGLVMHSRAVRRRMLADEICQHFRVTVEAQRGERGRDRAKHHRKQDDAENEGAR